MMKEQDQILISGLRDGDKAVFEQLFRSYYQELCGYSVRFVHDPLIAEEVVQDLFFKIWTRREELMITSSLRSYLFKAAYNHSLNFIRHREMHRRYFDYIGFEVEEISGNQHLYSDGELSGQVQKALLKLPEKRREIFMMSRFEGLKYHEIAEKLGIHVKTVETQMTRALEFLRDYLKEFMPIILLIISILKE